MKVAPSQIEFTLPSPKLGIESLPVIDPPWVPKFKTKINTIHERGQVTKISSNYRHLNQLTYLESLNISANIIKFFYIVIELL